MNSSQSDVTSKKNAVLAYVKGVSDNRRAEIHAAIAAMWANYRELGKRKTVEVRNDVNIEIDKLWRQYKEESLARSAKAMNYIKLLDKELHTVMRTYTNADERKPFDELMSIKPEEIETFDMNAFTITYYGE